MNNCHTNTCREDRQDVFRTNIVSRSCEESFDNCTKECKAIESSDCPYGQMSDKCIVYTGCKTFISQIRAGMTINQVINAFENTFEQIDRLIDRQNEEIEYLKERLSYLENLNKNGNRCDSFE